MSTPTAVPAPVPDAAARAARESRDELLRSTVRLARLVFAAGAASVFLYEADSDTLVLEASAGAGEDQLMGWRVPAHSGIAGWVHQTGETVMVSDVRSDPRFDRVSAESTGYVPTAMVAAPLATAQRSVGVIEILDPDLTDRRALASMELIDELARQCCAALVLLTPRRPIDSAVTATDRLVATITHLAGHHDTGIDDLLSSLDRVLNAVAAKQG